MHATAPIPSPPPRPAVMGSYRPDWLEKPSGDDMARFYPEHAARHDISGKAKIRCEVTSGGLLQQCEILEESPLGEHFGEAALKLAPKFRMIPPDDPTVAPGTVVIPIVFQVPEHYAHFLPDTPSGAQLMTRIGAGMGAISALLLIVMIWALGRHNGRAAIRSAERRPTGNP